jgi:iron complex transport system substrate-binding protein
MLILASSFVILAKANLRASRTRKAFTVTFSVFATSLCFAANSVTIIDERGKKIEIPQPLSRVCVINKSNVELVRAVAGMGSVVGMDARSAYDTEYWPGFNQANTCGASQTELDIEKIITLGTQVVISPSNGSWEDAERKLAPFGIKVVVLTGWASDGFIMRIATLGAMFDKDDRAQELIRFYQNTLDLIKKRTSSIKDKKKGRFWNSCVILESHIKATEMK